MKNINGQLTRNIAIALVMTIFLLVLLNSGQAMTTGPSINKLMVEFSTAPTVENKQEIISTLKKFPIGQVEVTLFSHYQSDYFKRLYEVSFESTTDLQDIAPLIKSKLSSLKNVSRIENVFSLQGYSLEVSRELFSELSKESTDPFFPYQWALKNRGQTVLTDIDDIHSERVKGIDGYDIGIDGVRKKIKSGQLVIKREVKVAVLDSGVDLDHADLKDNLFYNESECEQKKIPVKPTKDKDQNGFVGDCLGWNFVSNKKEGDERPYDDMGHGTHVAGIIAAKENSQGIRGVSQHIKILPVKVLSATNKTDTSPIGLSDRLAKGILYAVQRKVDIINLSLGWPVSLETKYLKEAIKEAQKQGILIVAAAGNNHHNNPIYPCAYQGVVCVGSMRPDGQFSSFSNYGSHVDVLAPGEEILSTFPMKITPNFFSTQGYEYKNGTSQAAPYVAGALALIKGIYPEISAHELREKIILGSRTIFQNGDHEEYILAGIMNLEHSLYLLLPQEQGKEQAPYLMPEMKENSEVKVNYPNGKFEWILPLKNIGADASNVDIKITFDNQSTHRIHFDQLASAQTTNVSIHETISDWKRDQLLPVKIDISGTDSKFKKVFQQTYHHELQLVKTMGSGAHLGDERWQVNPIDQAEKNMLSRIQTIADPENVLNYPEYFVENDYKEADGKYGKKISIYRLEKSRFAPLTKKLVIPNADSIILTLTKDMNDDGIKDYLVLSLAKENNQKYMGFSFFDQAGTPLFGERSHWNFTPTVALFNLKNLHWLKHNLKDLGKVYLPIFWEKGKIPDADKNPSPWEEDNEDARSNAMESHYYYLQPVIESGKVLLKTRMIDSYKWRDQLKKQLNIAWNDNIELFDIFPQQKKSGDAHALIATGKNYVAQTYIISLRPISTSNPAITFLSSPITDLHLTGYSQVLVQNLDTMSMDKSPQFSTWEGQESNTRMQLLNFNLVQETNRWKQGSNFQIHSKEPKDYLLSTLGHYARGEEKYSFFQTKGKLGLVHYNKDDGQISYQMRPLIRFSFIPGQLFKESFFPLLYKNLNQFEPAIYIDSTEINRKGLSIVTVNSSGKLWSPLDFNIEVPENCRALNPVRWGTGREYAMVLFCQNTDDASYVLKSFSLVNKN